MLTRIDDIQAAGLSPLLARMPIESVRIAALLHAYGTDHAFFTTYLQNRTKAVLSQIDDTFLLIDCGADYSELAFFMRMSPHFSTLLGTYPSLENIARLLPGGTLQRHIRMAAYARPSAEIKNVEIDRHPSLRDIYMLTGQAAASFDAWYADLSHRIRHGCARAYMVRIGRHPAAACLISAESRYAGLISSVTTEERWRGNGFASALVYAASADLFSCGKRPVLECAPSLCPFYIRLGFLRECETGTFLPQSGAESISPPEFSYD